MRKEMASRACPNSTCPKRLVWLWWPLTWESSLLCPDLSPCRHVLYWASVHGTFRCHIPTCSIRRARSGAIHSVRLDPYCNARLILSPFYRQGALGGKRVGCCSLRTLPSIWQRTNSVTWGPLCKRYTSEPGQRPFSCKARITYGCVYY